MLIFASDDAIEMLTNYTDFFGDSSFVTPIQLKFGIYVLGVLVGGQVFPCVYALLPNKKKETYIEMFRQISIITGDRMMPINFSMEALVKWGGVSKEFEPILTWFEFNYIGILDTKTRGCSRKSPKIPIEFWNVHNVIVEDIPRSNSSMYCWDKSFKSALRHTKSTLEDHINMIQKEERIHHQNMKMISEDELYRPKSKKRRCDDLIEKMAKGIDSYNGGYVLYLLHAAKFVMGKN